MDPFLFFVWSNLWIMYRSKNKGLKSNFIRKFSENWSSKNPNLLHNVLVLRYVDGKWWLTCDCKQMLTSCHACTWTQPPCKRRFWSPCPSPNFRFIVTPDSFYTDTLLMFLALLKLKTVENSDPHNFVGEDHLSCNINSKIITLRFEWLIQWIFSLSSIFFEYMPAFNTCVLKECIK